MVELPEPGEDWGGFRIDREIGRSSRGRTYAAYDRDERRTRALKVLTTVPSDDPAGERFQHHPVLASDLGHRNIVTVHAASDVDGTAFVVMDLYPAGSVADEIGVSVLRLARCRSVLAQVADALTAAHDVGLFHGNVKPTNILCGSDDAVVLSDFGSTRFVDDALRREPVSDEEVAGLPYHTAPEVLVGDPVGPAADTYSLTAVFFEMLTGRTPFAGRSAGELTDAHRSAPRPSVTTLRPDLPDAVDAFVERGMAVDPARRFATPAAFVEELDRTIDVAIEHRREQARRPRAAAEPADPFEAGPDSGGDDGDRTSRVEWDAPQPRTSEPGTSGSPATDDRVAALSDAASQGPDTASLPAVATTYGGSRRARRDGDWRLEDGTIDGAMVGVYEDEPRRRWPVVVVAVVLVIVIAVVGWLAYRAVQADSDTAAAPSPSVVQQTVFSGGST